MCKRAYRRDVRLAPLIGKYSRQHIVRYTLSFNGSQTVATEKLAFRRNARLFLSC